MIKQKVAYIVPSEAMQKSISDILSEEINEGSLDVMMIDIRDVENEYRRLCSKGYTCIIARGGTFTDLKAVSDIVPVVGERIRTADILEMVTHSGLSEGDIACIVIHKNTADGVENITDLSGGRIRVYRYNELDDLKRLLAEMPESGVKVFTSGYAAAISDRKDLELVELRNRPNTVRFNVRSTLDLISRTQNSIQQANTLNSIYNNIDEGILIFDKSGIITEANIKATEFFDVKRCEMIGRSVYDLVDGMPARRSDGNCSVESPRNFTGRLGKFLISYTVYHFEFFQGTARYMMTLQDVTKIQTLEQNIRFELSKKGLSAEHRFEDILTCEPAMQHVIDKARTIAAYDGAVMIYGESGTGKELFAQSIHNESSRSSGPFVAINCAALTESLLESELFGYAGGAFTGARKDGKAGLFELAHNGTIFLDEINSTPPSLQSKILRVIETQEVMRVGSDYVIPLNIRVISASNADLMKSIDEGNFRRDLYYRLSTFELTVPPMRSRSKDVLLLFRHYLSLFSGKADDADITLDPEFEAQLLTHSWKGNVREIRSVALRYNAFGGDNSSGDILVPISENSSASDQAKSVHADTSQVASASIIGSDDMIPLSQLSDTIERIVIRSLEDRGMSRTEIAKALGISRQGLYKKMNKE